MPGIRAWVLPTEASQDQNAGNPGLGGAAEACPPVKVIPCADCG